MKIRLAFDSLTEHIEQEWRSLTSVLIVHCGTVIYETYFNGTNEQTLFPLRSMTKSVTSALIGIAIDRGFIQSEQQRIQEFLDEDELLTSNPELHGATLHQLLSMTSGLQVFDKDLPRIILEHPTNWIEPILKSEVANPGTFAYKGCELHLLSALITCTTRKNAHEFAKHFLFNPLQINTCSWDTDPEGNSIGSTGLKMTAQDIAKLGALYLEHGIWNGEQILSREWIEKSTAVHSEGHPRYGTYGYGWWLAECNGVRSYMAAGAKGQYLINMPTLKTTVLITSDTTNDHSLDPREIVTSHVLPTLDNYLV